MGEVMLFSFFPLSVLACSTMQSDSAVDSGAEDSASQPEGLVYFFSAPTTLENLEDGTKIVAVRDMNLDGHIDLLLSNNAGGFFWREWDGSRFSESIALWEEDFGSIVVDAIESKYGIRLDNTTPSSHNYIFGDFNQDGALDLVRTVQIFDVEAYWTIVLTFSVMDENQRSHDVALVDTKHLTPSLIHNTENDRLAIFANDGILLFNGSGFTILSESTEYIFAGQIIARDLDEDGDEDWYVFHDGGYGFTRAQILRREGGVYTSTPIENPPSSHEVVCDEDEIWVPSSNGLHYLNAENEWQEISDWDSISSPVLGDFGGDGHLDVLAQRSDVFLTYYGDGLGQLTPFESNLNDLPYQHWVRDLNGDGKEDIIGQKYVPTSFSYEVSVLWAQ